MVRFLQDHGDSDISARESASEHPRFYVMEEYTTYRDVNGGFDEF